MKKGDKVLIGKQWKTTLLRKVPHIDSKAWEVFPHVLGLRFWNESDMIIIIKDSPVKK